MALNTKSAFYFGHVITDANYQLDFDEGSGEITAELNVGSYSLTEFITELERALNAASQLPQDYTVSVDRSTRLVTISASSSFSLLVSSGTHFGTSVFSLAGFTGANRASQTIHIGNSASGKEYLPQFELQEYVPSSNFKNPTSAAVNTSSSGVVEVVRFGNIQFMECNIKWVTNNDVSKADWIDNNPTAVEDLIEFLDNLIQKGIVEFMEDRSNRNTYETMILEKTRDSGDGVGYKLKELTSMKLPDWYETKLLTFRKIS